MKYLILGFILFHITLKSNAQTASVKDIEIKEGESISIEKNSTNKNNKGFEIETGDSEISGDPSVLEKNARENWKKACDQWKKEIKELNSENQILAISCNAPTCTRKTNNETSCDSKGTFKVKIKHIK